MSKVDDQQFCLRWNNFQANITSQFENLRDEEDFTDVTIACEGQQLQAHKIILSACSPLFKELFKSNPCPHPIIFMRDVEAQHIVALMEFMYAGEVNVAQTQLSAFLKTAESLKIRGLTDSSLLNAQDDNTPLSTKSSSPTKVQLCCSSSTDNKSQSTSSKLSCISAVTSSQDFPSSPDSLPSPNKQCKSEKNDTISINATDESKSEVSEDNPFSIQNNNVANVEPKLEIPDYLSDEEGKDDRDGFSNFDCGMDDDVTEFSGGMEIITQPPGANLKEFSLDNLSTLGKFRRRQMIDEYFSFSNGAQNITDKINTSYVHKENDKTSQMVKLGDGIEIYEDQLRSVKWSDYRKLTRGLATILFSPTELATCSVTGQRWSRAGNGERPVKPALDRAKVQAIISYVAMRFPTVEISRIKQVLAYKCKENSTAFKMKAVRYYGKHLKGSNN